jgi:protein O-GlcNAc transferase
MVGAPAAASAVAFAAGAKLAGIVLLGLDALLVIVMGVLQVVELARERRDALTPYLGHPLCSVAELTPYALGADPESPTALAKIGQKGHATYLRRDMDSDLRSALRAAGEASGSQMVVVYGPSKAGKTRSLFEAVHETYPKTTVVVPRDAASINELNGKRISSDDDSDLVIWWLEDLEDYVGVGAGMSLAVLRDLGEQGNVLVVATAGGKGGTRREDTVLERLAEPLADLLHHAVLFELGSELSDEERKRARAYAPKAVSAISRDGIGEFMITAPELELKLGSGKHRLVDDENPHGQAVTWGAIAWRRAGIVDPVPAETLRQLYPDYLPDHVDPSDADFESGLEWARKPLYKNVALVKGGPDSFEAHDHIASVANLPRAARESIWEKILDFATPSQAFAIGVVAYSHTNKAKQGEHAERAWKKAVGSPDTILSAAALFNLGILYRQDRRFEDAEAAFKRALEVDTGRADLKARMLSMYADLIGTRGDTKRAGELFEQALATQPEDSLTLSVYALFLRNSGANPERIEDLYERALAAGPDNADTLGNYALFFEEDRKDLDRATELFERAVVSDPNHANNLSNYALLRSKRGEDPDEIEGVFDRILRMDPEHASTFNNYAYFLKEARHDHERAQKFYERAVEIDPENPNYLSNFGAFLAETSRNPDLAEELFERVIAINPDDADNLGNYGLFLERRGTDPDRAQELYERAVAAAPHHANNLSNYASFLARREADPDRIEELFERAIAAGPNDADTLGSYALFQMSERKNATRANEIYEQALRADPTHSNNLNNYAVFQVNVRDDFDRAEELYERLIAARPDDCDHLVTYAHFLSSIRGDVNRAVELFEQVIDVNPKPKYLSSYAVLLAEKSIDLDRAESLFQRASAADENDPNILGNYAVFASSIREDFVRAAELYSRALELNPTHEQNLRNAAALQKVIAADPDLAEELYERRIRSDSANSDLLGAFAVFQSRARGDFDRAEELYEQALAIEPDNADNLSNYAIFQETVRSQFDRAEELYERALRVDPGHAHALSGYAAFRHIVRQDSDAAAALYERATAADSVRPETLGNYALFLSQRGEDPVRVEETYERALAAGLNQCESLSGYALFLDEVRRDPDHAEELYERALEANPEHGNTLGNYARHALTKGDRRKAEGLIERALRVAEDQSLLVELWIYRFASDGGTELAKQKIQTLVLGGARSPGWDLEGVLGQARSRSHPELSWLEKVVEVVSGGADAVILAEDD